MISPKGKQFIKDLLVPLYEEIVLLGACSVFFAIITGIKPYDKLHSILLGSLEHPVHDIILFRDPRKFCWNIKRSFFFCTVIEPLGILYNPGINAHLLACFKLLIPIGVFIYPVQLNKHTGKLWSPFELGSIRSQLLQIVNAERTGTHYTLIIGYFYPIPLKAVQHQFIIPHIMSLDKSKGFVWHHHPSPLFLSQHLFVHIFKELPAPFVVQCPLGEHACILNYHKTECTLVVLITLHPNGKSQRMKR